MRRYSATSASGSDSVTSISVRITASGVRSSCDAFATKRFCDSNAPASRSSIASNVRASSATSSSAPEYRIRWSSVSSPRRWAVAVTLCSGRSARPATAYAPAIPITLIRSSAIRPLTSSSRDARATTSACHVAASSVRPSDSTTWVPRRSSSAGCSASPTSTHASSTSTAPAATSRIPFRTVNRSRSVGRSRTRSRLRPR
jgi:hypothetical protein